MPPTIVQSLTNTGGTGNFTITVTAGDGLIICYFSDNAGNPTNHITGITDTQGNTWQSVSGTVQNGGGLGGFTEIWYTAAAASSGSVVITTITASSPSGGSFLYELSGTVTPVTGNGSTGTGVNATPLVITSPSVSATDAFYTAIAGQLNGPFNSFPTVNSPWSTDHITGADGEAGCAHALTTGSESAVLTWAVNWNNATTKDYTVSVAAFTAGSSTPAYVNVFCQS